MRGLCFDGPGEISHHRDLPLSEGSSTSRRFAAREDGLVEAALCVDC